MSEYFQYFNSQLYLDSYDEDENESKTEENEFQIIDNDNDIINHLESLLDDNDNNDSNLLYKSNTKNKKKRNNKKKKMKNYNIKKGDWQCQSCNNINFHFRAKCNICGRSK